MKQNLSLPGLLLFSVGALVAVSLVFIATWADLEASFYGFPRLTNERMGSLSCPVLITPGEITSVSMKIKNTSDSFGKGVVRTSISNPGPFRNFLERVSLEAGETKEFSWEITTDDSVLGERFVFAKVYQYAFPNITSSEAECGVFVVPIRFLNGWILYWGGWLLSILSMVFGLRLLQPADRPQQNRTLDAQNARQFLMIILLIGFFTSYSGWWPVSIGILAVAILTVLGLWVYSTSN